MAETTPTVTTPLDHPLTGATDGLRPETNGNLGLRGTWAQIANMTAVLLICLLFYQDRHAALGTAQEDRQLFREAIRDLREDSHKQWEQLREDSQRQWEAIRRLTSAVKALAEEKRPK